MLEELSFVENCMKSLAENFLQTPYIFWREFDAKSYLYHLLMLRPTPQKEYKTLDGKITNLIHTEYKSRLGGRFDIAIFNAETVEKHPFNDQKLLCGIELGLDRGSDHFAKDFLYKFRAEANNPVDFGYLVHLMRDKLSSWDGTLRDIENNLMPSNSEFFFQPTRTDECGVLIVKVRIKEQEPWM